MINQDILNKLKNYLPATLSKLLTPDISLTDATTVVIHCASVRAVLSTYLPKYLVEGVVKGLEPGIADGNFRYGTVMFADVSGFTAMSEKLSALGKEGAEEVTAVVNNYFETMLKISDGFGGDLLKFGGDALLLFFEGADGARRAVITAEAMQQAMGDFARVQTSQGDFTLRMSIGMGTGSILFATLGSDEDMEYVVIGQALTHMAQAENTAIAGQIVVDAATQKVTESLANYTPIDDFWLLRQLTQSAHPSQILKSINADEPDWINADISALLEIAKSHVDVIDGLKLFVPRQILERLIENPQNPRLAGAHRPVTVMFANFQGIDEIIDALGETHEYQIVQILDTYFSQMNQIIHKYGGVVNKVDAYTVGHRIMALFGALQAHEDDPLRAVRASLEMNEALAMVNRKTQDILRQISGGIADTFGDSPLKQRIGLNSGFVFAGNVGAEARHEYSVMGDEVNLTARLMSVATEGDVLVSRQIANRVEAEFELAEQSPVRVKGKSQPVRNFLVLKERQNTRVWTRLASSEMIGRDAELEIALNALASAKSGQGQVLVISGASGIGKTRMAEAVAYHAEQDNLTILAGTCLSYGKTLTYHPWADILREHFQIKADDDTQRRLTAVEEGMNAIDELQWSPVMADVLGLSMPDNDLTRSLDSKLRRQRILDITVKLLRHAAEQKPAVIIFEDAHWADPASMDLLNYVVRNIAGHAILLVLPHRSDADLPDWLAFDHAVNLPLLDLTPKAGLKIARRMLDNISLPKSLAKMITEKGDGNPFFIAEVVRVLIDSGVFRQDETGHWSVSEVLGAIELPDTIHGMIISRIDRLLEVDRQILRTASVVGRVFAQSIVNGVYGGTKEILDTHLQYLETQGLTELFSPESLLYRFNHLTTQEVVYETLSFESRREFHRRIGDFIETAYADAIGEQIDLLAYHYFEGQNWEKAMRYNLLAAKHAQREFANDTAIEAYQRVLQSTQKVDAASSFETRLQAHEALGDVLSLTGGFDAALTHLESARTLVAQQTGDTQAAHLAELARKTANVHERRSEFDIAFEWLNKGLQYLNSEIPDAQSARIYLLGAGLFQRQGKHDEAIQWCERSLDVSTQLPSREGQQLVAHAYYNLGGIYIRRGDLRRAVDFCRKSIEAYKTIDDIVGLSHAYNNAGNAYNVLGNWPAATESYQKSLAMKKQIGDVIYQGFLFNNLGSLLTSQGKWSEAEDLLKKSGRIWKLVGAALPEAVTLSNLSQVYIYQQNWTDARANLVKSETLFDKLESEDFLAELERRWAEYYLHTHDVLSAQKHIRQSLELAVRHEARVEEGMSCRVLGLVHLAKQETKQAEIALQKSLKILSDLDSEYEVAKTKLTLSRVLKLTQADQAEKYREEARQTFERLGAQADLQAAKST